MKKPNDIMTIIINSNRYTNNGKIILTIVLNYNKFMTFSIEVFFFYLFIKNQNKLKIQID